MSIDAATLITRTDSGNAELVKPSNGLSIGQRRILASLASPTVVGALMATHQLDAPRLERDLAKLQDLRLVEVQGQMRDAPPPPPAVATPAVVLGGPRQGSPMRWVVGLAFIVGAGGVYMVYRAPSPPVDTTAAVAPRPVPPATVAAGTSAPAPSLQPAAQPAPIPAVLPVSATMLGDAPGRERKPDARPEPRPAPPIADSRIAEPKVPLVQSLAPPAPAPSREPAAALATAIAPTPASAPAAPRSLPATPATSEVAAVAPAPAPTPAPVAAPPIQLATAAPPAAETRAPARPALPDIKTLSREQPVFPREAVSAGVSKGLVKAHLSVDAAGKVAAVSIIESTPRRVFDRAAISALYGWTFTAGAPGRGIDVEVAFDKNSAD